MQDGPAIATLLFLALVFATYTVLTRLARAALRRAGAAVLGEVLVHWRYPPGAWHAYCERQRAGLWYQALRPALRYLLPLLVVVGGVALAAALRVGLSPALATLLVLFIGALVGNMLVGPPLRAYLALSRRCRLDYELRLGTDGALETWRDAAGVRDTESHPFTAGASRIARVEAHGVDPAEIVFTLVQPLTYGFQHIELRFPVPDGLLAEARALARRLSPESPGSGPDDWQG